MLAPLTVWYNTKCPVCNAGISRQQRKLRAAAKSGAIVFRDINLEPEALRTYGVGVNDVRRRLHATDPEGRLHVGADCAIEIWRRTPGDAWLAGVVGLPVVKSIARVVYDRFADVLFAWNKRNGRW